MPDIGGSTNDAFGAGVNHVRSPGRANVGSITLGTDAGLEQTSERWDSMSPHGVLRTALTSQDDSSWERFQREQGGYQPGSMTTMQDQISDGTNDLP